MLRDLDGPAHLRARRASDLDAAVRPPDHVRDLQPLRPGATRKPRAISARRRGRPSAMSCCRSSRPRVIGIGLFGFTLSWDEIARSSQAIGAVNTLPLDLQGLTTTVTNAGHLCARHRHLGGVLRGDHACARHHPHAQQAAGGQGLGRRQRACLNCRCDFTSSIPTPPPSMTAKIAAAARAVALPDTVIDARQPTMGPVSIEGFYDEAFAVPGMLGCIRDGRPRRRGRAISSPASTTPASTPRAPRRKRR